MEELNSIIEKEISLGEGLSVVSLVDNLIKYASFLNASDIHLDPREQDLRVRFRIDGVLEDSHPIPKIFHSEVISRIKVLSELRTDEHNATQDGRFRILVSGTKNVDVRVSIVPTHHGENAVLRLLFEGAENFTLNTLGFTETDQKKIVSAIHKPSGMILVTGPTGSGKTTTLYTLLKILNSQEISIVTIEDPIEYAISGIRQIQTNDRSALNFANGLRSVLRQDPDIIMVGEIRDKETASIAVNASLTGHILLSTLHTNDASTAIPRLLDMKVEPFLVASTISLVIGQRLVRKICKSCKQQKYLSNEEYNRLSECIPASVLQSRRNFFYGKGCEFCNKTGYKGRAIIAEVLFVDGEIRDAIVRKASADEIRKISLKNGMGSMLLDGYQKALAGITTLEEVMRVTYE